MTTTVVRAGTQAEIATVVGHAIGVPTDRAPQTVVDREAGMALGTIARDAMIPKTGQSLA
jgi:hypothetical protein